MLRFLPLAFGVLLAHFVWYTWCERPSGEYVVGGNVQALSSPDDNQQCLYLRHAFHAPVRPRFGWLQVLARSRVSLYVNGEPVADHEEDGFDVATLVDIAPFLHQGKNVIAIRAEQSPRVQAAFPFPAGKRSLVSVQGAYGSGAQLITIDSSSTWRYHHAPALRNHWWFEAEYEDRHWPHAERLATVMRASVSFPPRAIQEISRAAWIGPRLRNRGHCVLYRVFRIPSNVESAWLRLSCNSDYRLAVNGVICDTQERTVATNIAPTPERRIYDLTSFLRRGKNVLAIAVTGDTIEPRLLADLGVLGKRFGEIQICTDGQWQARSDVSPGWPTACAGGEPAIVEAGDSFGRAWTFSTEIQPLVYPRKWLTAYWTRRVGLSLVVALLSALGCILIQPLFGARSNTTVRTPPIADLAIVIPLVGLLTAWLATFDPRVDAALLFQPITVYLAIGTIFAQWMLFAVLRSPSVASYQHVIRRGATNRAVIVRPILIIMVVGCLLRFGQLDAKPLQHDEASALRSTRGFFEYGFPSRRIHVDAPIKYVETSELVYFCNVLSMLVFDDDRYVVRIPAACWGTATILLIYIVGSRMFAAPVGVIAAATYALSPICIQMACFGRYFTQLQFFCLLTVYLFWLTIRGSRIHRRYLAGTTLSFLAMYFTWQGSALMAAGLVVACIWTRRRNLQLILQDRSVWLAMAIVACTVVLHISLRSLHLRQFLTYGTGISGLTLKPMWKFPDFNITYCIWESAWNRDALFPMLGIMGGCLMAIRHPFHRSVRFLLLVFLATAVLQSCVLPVYTWRYSFHFVPFGILLFGVSLFALCQNLVPRRSDRHLYGRWQDYPELVATTTAVVLVLVASGITVQLTKLRHVHIHEYALPDLIFGDVAGATDYLRSRLRDNDIVLASNPELVEHFLGETTTDYWPQSRFYTQAILDDYRQVPLHRITGTVMLSSTQEWQGLFARKGRIWYVLVPSRHASQNTTNVSAFLRQNMRVAYEGHRVLVLVRENEHRPAAQRLRNDRVLTKAVADYLAD